MFMLNKKDKEDKKNLHQLSVELDNYLTCGIRLYDECQSNDLLIRFKESLVNVMKNSEDRQTSCFKLCENLKNKTEELQQNKSTSDLKENDLQFRNSIVETVQQCKKLIEEYNLREARCTRKTYLAIVLFALSMIIIDYISRELDISAKYTMAQAQNTGSFAQSTVMGRVVIQNENLR